MSQDAGSDFPYETAWDEPDEREIDNAAMLLERPARYTDAEGFDVEIEAAAIHPALTLIAYLECRARTVGTYVDIAFHLHIQGEGDRHAAWEVQTYNPYFGCDPGFLRWHGETVLMIYREKHHTYIARFGLDFPVQWKVLEDNWKLRGNEVGYWGYQAARVRRLRLPSLTELPDSSEEEARAAGLLPAKYW